MVQDNLPVSNVIDDETAARFESIDDAVAFFNSNSSVVSITDVAGDGYSLLKDKATLENIPFLIIDWNGVVDPDTQRDYASIRLITADGRKYRVNDGSTGIYSQLKTIRDRTKLIGGIKVPKGLFKSEYFVDDKTKRPIPPDKIDSFKGAKSKAVTWYLNES